MSNSFGRAAKAEQAEKLVKAGQVLDRTWLMGL